MRHSLLLTAIVVMACESACASLPAQEDRTAPVTCRIASRTTGTVRAITVLAENDLDTRNSAASTIEAVINDGRRLDATVRRVDIAMPRERFNVALSLDGRTHLRVNHMDLDIYLETVIDGQTYLLHCFRDFESPFTAGN